jgi:uncharacterized protein (UPF0305 family)
MARAKNDGKGRLGGRAKGTPNKTTSTIRDFIQDVVEANKSQIKADLKQLEPKDRLIILEKLMSYVVPKMQSVSGDIQVKQEPEKTEEEIKAELERLRRLRDE